jgi:DNA-binding beta-propeller fold protein YncE
MWGVRTVASDLKPLAGRAGVGVALAVAAIALAAPPAPGPGAGGNGRGPGAAARPADAPPGLRQRATTAPAAVRASDRARERAQGWPFRALPNQSLPEMQSPLRMALAGDGELLVSDYTGRMILAVARESLEVVGAMPINGRPAAVAVVGDRVLVGNESRARVEVHSPDGQCLYEFDAPVRQPNDMAVSSELGLVFVVATQEKVVKVFALDGTLVGMIPAPGQEPLGNPTAIAVEPAPFLVSDINGDGIVDIDDFLSVMDTWGLCPDAAEPCPADLDGNGSVGVEDFVQLLEDWGPARVHVIVSDYGDRNAAIRPAVRIYDEQGNHIRTMRGRFSRPQGLATDGNGHLFLVDAMLCQVLVIDQESGALVTTLGEFGSEPGQLRLPLDVAVDAESKQVLVTNNRLRRIEAFPDGTVVP